MLGSNLYQEWLEAKEAERKAIARRRDLEDEMLSAIGFSGQEEGTKTIEDCGYAVKITTRINRTINGDLLQEVAAEHGLTEHLSTLFRWKPEINMKGWKDADKSITTPLSRAITAKPGRPTFNIERMEG